MSPYIAKCLFVSSRTAENVIFFMVIKEDKKRKKKKGWGGFRLSNEDYFSTIIKKGI